MATRLQLLHVEDSEEDALLLLAELRGAGYLPDVVRVETPEAFAAALDARTWDLVVTDNMLPRFTGRAALDLFKARGLDVPFVIVSGTIGEEDACAFMREGASDFVLKGHLARLGPIIDRELREAESRRNRRQAEDELRRATAQLQQAQKMEAVGRLAGGIAHDFNNLLSVMLGYTELLLADAPAGSALRADLEEVRKAGQSAVQLSRQLLTFSRQQPLAPAALDPQTVLADVANLLGGVMGAGIERQISVHTDGALIMADAVQIEQVLLNLAINARDAMPDGGRLMIAATIEDVAQAVVDPPSTVAPGAYVVFAVSDTGSGMTTEVRDRIFEPFFTTKDLVHGTGLGLSVVQGIVSQNHGAVGVTSAPGAGTTFRIYWPRATAPASRRPAAEPARGGETILVVDDEPELRTLMRRMLEPAGYALLSACDGLDALTQMQAPASRVALVVTDVVMPNMGGPELVDRLRTHHPGVRVVFVSGHIQHPLLPEQIAAGVPLLSKPFTKDALLRQVREALDAPPPWRPLEE